VVRACASMIAIELGSPALEDPVGRYRLKQQARPSSMRGPVSTNSATSIRLLKPIKEQGQASVKVLNGLDVG
jgi:hypothetical protein